MPHAVWLLKNWFTVIYRSKDANLPEEPWENGPSGEVYFDVSRSPSTSVGEFE